MPRGPLNPIPFCRWLLRFLSSREDHPHEIAGVDGAPLAAVLDALGAIVGVDVKEAVAQRIGSVL